MELVMALGIRRSFKILGPGGSLRRRVAYSLAIVPLILVPVIFLAVYCLFAMGWMVDRIVNVDAPATTMSEPVSVEMLEARRAERNYSYFATLRMLKRTAPQSRISYCMKEGSGKMQPHASISDRWMKAPTAGFAPNG
jgi:hypothetical protein